MSATEKAIGIVKSVLLFRERLERLDASLGELGAELAMLARDHAELSERVSRIEGFIEGAAAASASPTQRKLPRK